MEIVFKLKQIVYNIIDTDQEPLIVTGIVSRPNNQITYLVSNSRSESEIDDFMLSKEKTIF